VDSALPSQRPCNTQTGCDASTKWTDSFHRLKADAILGFHSAAAGMNTYEQLSQATSDAISSHASTNSIDVVNQQSSRSREADEFVRYARDYVLELIRVNESGLNFYRNLDASVIKRWFEENCPGLRRCLTKMETSLAQGQWAFARATAPYYGSEQFLLPPPSNS
jgi:hypothetical protein